MNCAEPIITYKWRFTKKLFKSNNSWVRIETWSYWLGIIKHITWVIRSSFLFLSQFVSSIITIDLLFRIEPNNVDNCSLPVRVCLEGQLWCFLSMCTTIWMALLQLPTFRALYELSILYHNFCHQYVILNIIIFNTLRCLSLIF